jgi:tRNA pseudouridine38-40 synthase
MTFLLKLSYLGKNYHGFQIQPNAVTVEGTLSRAIDKIFGGGHKIIGCSRTDKGVHANVFYCTVTINETAVSIPRARIPLARIPFALNANLPRDIAVSDCITVDESFNPRYNVKYKEYIYLIWNKPHRNPFYDGLALHYPSRLNLDAIRLAVRQFVGTHDFCGFMSSGSDVVNTVRNILYFDIEDDGGFVKFIIAADGFLYNMVRIIVGTLLYVSEGKIKPDEIGGIILSRDRKRAGYTAPPDGLYLNKVVYGDIL